MSTIPIIKQSTNNKAKRMHFNVSKVPKARLRPWKISNTALICRAKVQLSLKKHLRRNISLTYKTCYAFIQFCKGIRSQKIKNKNQQGNKLPHSDGILEFQTKHVQITP